MQDDGPMLGFTDWEGWEYKIDSTPQFKEALQPLGDKKTSRADKDQLVLPIAWGKWNDHVL